jgi:hypothetical protein
MGLRVRALLLERAQPTGQRRASLVQRTASLGVVERFGHAVEVALERRRQRLARRRQEEGQRLLARRVVGSVFARGVGKRPKRAGVLEQAFQRVDVRQQRRPLGMLARALGDRLLLGRRQVRITQNACFEVFHKRKYCGIHFSFNNIDAPLTERITCFS